MNVGSTHAANVSASGGDHFGTCFAHRIRKRWGAEAMQPGPPIEVASGRALREGLGRAAL
jgi:hypothetical protein